MSPKNVCMATTISVSNRGFSLLECLIALAIMAILTALAVPSYRQYTRRAYYSSLIQSTTPYQFGVALCLQESGDIHACEAGSHGIPAAIHQQQQIAELSVHQGVIRLVPQALHGLTASDTYILRPQISTIGISWQRSGGAIKKGYAH